MKTLFLSALLLTSLSAFAEDTALQCSFANGTSHKQLLCKSTGGGSCQGEVSDVIGKTKLTAYLIASKYQSHKFVLSVFDQTETHLGAAMFETDNIFNVIDGMDGVIKLSAVVGQKVFSVSCSKYAATNE